MNHREYFNSLAPGWDKMMGHNPAKLGRIIDSLQIKAGCRILDVGCGTGVFVESLLARFGEGIQIICVDISERMLEIAWNKFQVVPTVSYVTADITEPILRNESLDRVICYSCIPHIREKSRAFFQFRRMLKPGGMLVIAHSDGRDAINRMHESLGEPVKYDLLPDCGEMREFLEASGFRDVQVIDEPDFFEIIAR